MIFEKLKELSDVLAVVLFGSSARGDNDLHSDKDIFIMCRDIPRQKLIAFKSIHIYNGLEKDGNICVYRSKDILKMAGKGSLFLWHLKLEGKLIFSKDGIFEDIISELKEYEDYKESFQIYLKILEDIKGYHYKHRHLSEFDLAILFTLSRNTCMQLCVKNGIPKFGRKDVYTTAAKIYGSDLPITEKLYDYLFGWKRWYERGVRQSRSEMNVYKWCKVIEDVEKLVQFGVRHCT